jgi:hypothetical protein
MSYSIANILEQFPVCRQDIGQESHQKRFKTHAEQHSSQNNGLYVPLSSPGEVVIQETKPNQKACTGQYEGNAPEKTKWPINNKDAQHRHDGTLDISRDTPRLQFK